MYYDNIMVTALRVANLSEDPSAKVGCVIVNKDGDILSVGFNRKKKNVKHNMMDYINVNKHVKQYAFEHAEKVALDALPKSAVGQLVDVYITYPSCMQCTTEMLLNSECKVNTVYYISTGSDSFKERYKVNEALETMQNLGVTPIPIKEDIKWDIL